MWVTSCNIVMYITPGNSTMQNPWGVPRGWNCFFQKNFKVKEGKEGGRVAVQYVSVWVLQCIFSQLFQSSLTQKRQHEGRSSRMCTPSRSRKFCERWRLRPRCRKWKNASYTLGDDPNRWFHFWPAFLALLGPFWHDLCSHHVYLVWRGLSFGSEMIKIRVFRGCGQDVENERMYLTL